MASSRIANQLGFNRLLQSTAVGACLLALPAGAHAENSCPWINETTASGLLGAEAVGNATGAAPGRPGECTFVAQREGATHTLRIVVEIAADPHARLGELAHLCATGAANMPAIGNEAVVCDNDNKGALGERVIGRVRDQVFSVTINSTQKHDPLLDRSALKARIYTAAEQVSGNLF